MSYAYPRSTGASSLPSYKSASSQSPNFFNQALDRIPGAKQWVENGVAAMGSQRPRDRSDAQSSATRIFKRLFTVANAVILVWVFTLWWGERTVFQEHIDACVWDNWEHWVGHAKPRRRPRSHIFSELLLLNMNQLLIIYFNVISQSMLLRIMLPLSPIHSSLIPTPTPAARGHCQP